MMCKYIYIKVKEKKHKILEIIKLSKGNNGNNFCYNRKKSETSSKNLGIIYYKNYIKKNIGKMIYKTTENEKETKIFNKLFISNNIAKAKIILNNKQYDLKGNIENKKIKKTSLKLK